MKFNFLPSKEFKEKAKTRFLAVFDAQFPASARPRASEFVLAMRALAVVLGVAAVVFGGASVYADTQNVAADNPLYPLKRLSESVQLSLTPGTAKLQVEASIAARRAEEIADLEERHPSSTLLPGLTKDLTKAVRASMNEEGGDENDNAAVNATSSESAAQSHGKQKGLEEVCATLQPFLGLLDSSETLQRFEDRCGTSSVSVPAGAAATSTIQIRGENDQEKSQNLHLNVNVTSTVQSGRRGGGESGGDSENPRGTGILDENLEF